MKSFYLIFIFTFYSFCTFSQTLDHNYTPYLYLGAPKTVLIEQVIELAKSFYLYDVGGVIKQQKKKGVNLKKEKALEEFLVIMGNDMNRQLTAENSWSSESVNFSKWIFSIEELMGYGFKLPGFMFAKINKSTYEMVTTSFMNEKLVSIYTSIDIASPSSPTTYIYNNQLLQTIHNNIMTLYSKSATHTTKNYENFLGGQIYPAVNLAYTFSHPKINYTLGFDFLPYGVQDRAGNWTYRGTSWQRIVLSASLK